MIIHTQEHYNTMEYLGTLREARHPKFSWIDWQTIAAKAPWFTETPPPLWIISPVLKWYCLKAPPPPPLLSPPTSFEISPLRSIWGTSYVPGPLSITPSSITINEPPSFAPQKSRRGSPASDRVFMYARTGVFTQSHIKLINYCYWHD